MTPQELKLILSYEQHKLTIRRLVKKYDVNNLYKNADSSIPKQLIRRLQNLRKED